MRSRTVFAAGLSLVTFAFGARAAEDPTPPELKAVQEKATSGDQFTDREAGIVNGTV
jgi:hypothetical protein